MNDTPNYSGKVETVSKECIEALQEAVRNEKMDSLKREIDAMQKIYENIKDIPPHRAEKVMLAAKILATPDKP